MSRRNQGPRLKWLSKRNCYYIVWTEGGRSRERSTGTADREQAEVVLQEWLRSRQHIVGSRDPAEVLVTDILATYAEKRGPKVVAPDRIGYALIPLAAFWEGKSVADINEDTCAAYVEYRKAKVINPELETWLVTGIDHKQTKTILPPCGRARPASGFVLLGGREICAFELTGNELISSGDSAGLRRYPTMSIQRYSSSGS